MLDERALTVKMTAKLGLFYDHLGVTLFDEQHAIYHR